MKYFMIFLIPLTILQSCKEDPSIIPDIYWGEASAIKNGEPWSGRIYAQPNEPYGYGFDISIDVFNNQEFLREVLHIAKIPYNMSKTKIDTLDIRVDVTLTAASYSSLVDDGDVLGDLFKVYEGEEENYIIITEYNEETGEIRGEFEVAFVFDEGPLGTRSDPTVPDTIRFTNGTFHTKIGKGQ